MRPCHGCEAQSPTNPPKLGLTRIHPGPTFLISCALLGLVPFKTVTLFTPPRQINLVKKFKFILVSGDDLVVIGQLRVFKLMILV